MKYYFYRTCSTTPVFVSTQLLSGDVDFPLIPWCVVFWTRIARIVRILYLGNAKSGSLVPLWGSTKLSVLSVLSVFNNNIHLWSNAHKSPSVKSEFGFYDHGLGLLFLDVFGFWTRIARITRIIFLGTWIFLWFRDALGFEHGLHGLHG